MPSVSDCFQFLYKLKCVSKVLGHSLKASSAHICPRTFETHFISEILFLCIYWLIHPSVQFTSVPWHLAQNGSRFCHIWAPTACYLGVKYELCCFNKKLFVALAKSWLQWKDKYCRENKNDEFSGADIELAQIFADKLGLARFRWLRTNTWGGPIDKARKEWTGIVGNVSILYKN